MVWGNYGVFLRNDGTNTYLLMTANGNPYGTWTNARPIVVDDASGEIALGYADNTSVNANGNVSVGGTCSLEGALGYDIISATHQPVYCSSSHKWTEFNPTASATWHNCMTSGVCASGGISTTMTNSTTYTNTLSYPIQLAITGNTAVNGCGSGCAFSQANIYVNSVLIAYDYHQDEGQGYSHAYASIPAWRHVLHSLYQRLFVCVRTLLGPSRSKARLPFSEKRRPSFISSAICWSAAVRDARGYRDHR